MGRPAGRAIFAAAWPRRCARPRISRASSDGRAAVAGAKRSRWECGPRDPRPPPSILARLVHCKAQVSIARHAEPTTVHILTRAAAQSLISRASSRTDGSAARAAHARFRSSGAGQAAGFNRAPSGALGRGHRRSRPARPAVAHPHRPGCRPGECARVRQRAPISEPQSPGRAGPGRVVVIAEAARTRPRGCRQTRKIECRRRVADRLGQLVGPTLGGTDPGGLSGLLGAVLPLLRPGQSDL